MLESVLSAPTSRTSYATTSHRGDEERHSDGSLSYGGAFGWGFPAAALSVGVRELLLVLFYAPSFML